MDCDVVIDCLPIQTIRSFLNNILCINGYTKVVDFAETRIAILFNVGCGARIPPLNYRLCQCAFGQCVVIAGYVNAIPHSRCRRSPHRIFVWSVAVQNSWSNRRTVEINQRISIKQPNDYVSTGDQPADAVFLIGNFVDFNCDTYRANELEMK